MTLVTPKNRIGSAEIESFSATEAKNSFGRVLDRAIANGIVTITRRREPRAVLLAIEEYEALTAQRDDPLDRLRGEFDDLVARMQGPEAKAAGEALFAASRRGSKSTVRGASHKRR